MNYLITGGAGFIGSNLANFLASHENKVTVIDNLSMGKRENLSNRYVHFIEGDVCDTVLLKKELGSNQYDYIFLLAAIASVGDSVKRPLETHKVNFNSILTILEIIRTTQIHLRRVVFSSSAAVYGTEPTLPKSEKSPIMPLTPYAIDKFASENYVIAYNNLYGVPTSVVRFFNVYGMNQNPESDYSGVLSILLKQFKKAYHGDEGKFNIYGNGCQLRDFIFIKDVIDALILISENEYSKGEVFNVGTGKGTSIKKVISIFEKFTDKQVKMVYLPSRSGDIAQSYADVTKLINLGYAPRYTVEEGIDEYLAKEIY